MQGSARIFGWSQIGIAAIVAAVCIPLLLGRIKMNAFYGFRFRQSFASDDNWYRINAYGARVMLIWCGVLAALGIWLVLLPIPSGLFWVAANLPLILLIPAWQSYRFARSLDLDSSTPGTCVGHGGARPPGGRP